MADDAVLQSQIARPGQSQPERPPAELEDHFVDVDERTPEALMSYAGWLANPGFPPPKGFEGVPFVEAGDGAVDTTGWTPLFTSSVSDGKTKPALALYDAFLRLYNQGPRDAINRLTAGHLDFFYRRVLGFAPRGPQPDRVHAIVTLKKGSPAVRIQPQDLFSAGKDAAGVEQLYSPSADVVVNTSQVAALRSIFVGTSGGGRIRFAPVANSSDGLGGALPGEAPYWRPFGHAGLPAADVGFAVASPILRLKEGDRTIMLTLSLDPATVSIPGGGLAGAFDAFLTGEKQWLGPYATVASLSAGVLEIRITLGRDEPAVVDYDPKTHAHSYATDAPVLQLLVRAGGGLRYRDLSRLRLDSARIAVDVEGVTSLALESDAGTLDPKKAFLPFGPQPGAGSRFAIGCEEALSKSLSGLGLTLQWKGAPRDFATQYSGYQSDFSITNDAFTASVVLGDRATKTSTRVALFDATDARRSVELHLLSTGAPEPPEARGLYVRALGLAGTAWGRLTAQRMILLHPTTGTFLHEAPEARKGSIVLSLDRSFLHQEYRQQSLAKIIARTTDSGVALLNEPYTPTLQSLSLSYAARTAEVRVSSTRDEDFARLDVQFFHVGPFGQMREHGHQRAQTGFLGDTRVPLVPVHPDAGELLIGLSGLSGGDSVSLLFQVAEGSADPDVRAERPQWSVLCDNYWKSLGAEGVVRDTTNLLLTSGVVTIVIPKEATTENTLLPPGLIWLKAATSQDPESTCQLVEVAANAVELRWVMTSEDTSGAHLDTALPPGSITRTAVPIADIARVAQPYASFGGRGREDDRSLRVRASERLRHRNRAITIWDYERLVLDAFPSVHRVKGIPHSRSGSWMAPGHVLVVVVPDLRNRNATDPLRPKVDADTIARIAEFLRYRNPGQAGIEVKNPAYQRLQIDCRVKFRAGYEFNVYRRETIQALVRALSPWAFDSDAPLLFGGRVHASTLLSFIEALPYVDYVTDFILRSSPEGGRPAVVERAEAATPDAILVSDRTHLIAEAV